MRGFACLLCLAGLIASGLPTAQPAPAPQPEGFEVTRLAEGVYALIRSEPVGLMVDANTVFIINDEDVVVVDANLGPASARASIAALRRLTRKPVRRLINTHWHDDHVLGNATWREAFPDIEFIGHRSMADYLPGQGLKNRQAMLRDAPAGVAMLRSLLEKARDMDGRELSPQARQAYSSDIRLVERYLAETPSVDIVGPTRLVEDRLVLEHGSRRIEVLHLGRGHTAGDLVVHLAAERIVITGDLVVAPVPLIGRDQSHVGDWPATLERVLGLGAALLVPGHGPVQRDDRYVRQQIGLLEDLRRAVQDARARGEPEAIARKNIRLPDQRERFAGADPVRNLLFGQYVLGPGIGALYREP